MVNTYAPQLSSVFVGLSTDTKPAAGLGSKFVETDTSDVYVMLSGTWTQVGKLSTTATVSFTV